MPQPIDLTGRTFGRLTVLGLSAERIRGRCAWDCRCECGAVRVVAGQSLRIGCTRSCGCLQRDLARAKARATNASLLRGATHPRAKLTPALVREARRLAADGVTGFR